MKVTQKAGTSVLICVYKVISTSVHIEFTDLLALFVRHAKQQRAHFLDEAYIRQFVTQMLAFTTSSGLSRPLLPRTSIKARIVDGHDSTFDCVTQQNAQPDPITHT